jgi:hypothetical protein
MELGEVKKYYEWETTSRRGQVEIYMAETEDTVYFESGRFVSKEEWESGALRQIEEFEYNSKTVNVPQEDQFAKWESMLGNEPQVVSEEPTIQQQIKPVEEINPIRVILEKQKKKETISIPVEIKIEIPNKKVMSLLDMMFDREEVTQELIKLITASIDVDSIVGEIESQIRSSIEDSYEDEDEK